MNNQASMQSGVIRTRDARLVARPYLQITTAGVVGLGLLGGWAGSNWPTVLAIFVALIVAILGISRNARLIGPKPIHVYASAAINLTASSAIVLLTGGPASPFWLLFLVGAIASAMSVLGRAGEILEWLNTGVAATTFFVPQLRALPLERSLLSLAAMQVLTLFMTSRMLRTIVSLVLESGEKLSESDERFRRLVEHARDLIFTISADGTFTSLNPAFETFTGWTREKWVGARFDDLLTEADRGRAHEQFERILKGETLRSSRLNVHTRQGSPMVVEMNMSPQFKDGQVLGLLGIARDMTQEQQAEDALRASEEQYRRLVDHSPYGIIILIQDKAVFANPAATRMIGASSAEEVLGKSVVDLVHPDSRPTVMQRLREKDEGSEVPPLEGEFVRMDGSMIDVEVSAFPYTYQDQPAIQVVFQDITERKRAEQLQQALYDIARTPDEIGSLDDLYLRIHQIISGIMPAKNFYMALYDAEEDKLLFPYFVDQADRVEVTGTNPERGLTAYVLRTGTSLLCTREVHDQLERSGEIKLLGSPSAIWLGVPLVVESKTIGAMVVQDYSNPDAYSQRDQKVLEYVSSQVAKAIERKQAEETLRLNEQRLRQIIDLVPHFIFAKDDQGQFILANQAVADVYGTTVEELIGKYDADFAKSDQEVQHFRSDDLEVVLSGLPMHIPEEPITDAEGYVRMLATTKIPFTFSGTSTPAVLGVSVDITERKKAEAALHASEERFLKAFHSNASSASITRLSDGQLIEVNESFLRHTGYSRDEIIGRTTEEIGLWADPEERQQYLTLFQTQGRVENFEWHALTREGELRDVMFSTETIEVQGEACVVATAVDITERKRAEQEHAQLLAAEQRRRREALALAEVGRTISESLQLEEVLERIATYAKDLLAAETSAVYLAAPSTTSLRAVAALGPDAQEIKDSPVQMGAGILGSIALQRSAEIVNDTSTDARALTIEGTDAGVPFEHLMGVPVLARDELIGLIAVWRVGRGQDFNAEEMEFLTALAAQVGVAIENARLFQESRQLNADLEARVAERTAELLRAKDQAEAVNTELDAFSYSVSHDLRAPLRAIDGFSRILVKEYGPQLPAEAQNYIINIVRSSRRMAQLIEDLLTLSRVTRRELRHELVDLSKLAGMIAQGFSADSPQRAAEFIIASDLVATGDPGLLHIVLENLLNNAWKYTSKREQARIEFGALPASALRPPPTRRATGALREGDAGDGGPIFFVRDNGAGFDMAFANNLFGTFQRLHAESEFEGTGVGLATVQRIIHRHGGQVWAKAEVDKGATFYFTLG